MVLVISYYANIKHTCSHVGACMSTSRCQHLFSLWLDHNLCNRCKRKRRNELWRVHNFINMKECFKRYEEALVIQEVTFCPRLEKRCSHISIPQKMCNQNGWLSQDHFIYSWRSCPMSFLTQIIQAHNNVVLLTSSCDLSGRDYITSGRSGTTKLIILYVLYALFHMKKIPHVFCSFPNATEPYLDHPPNMYLPVGLQPPNISKKISITS